MTALPPADHKPDDDITASASSAETSPAAESANAGVSNQLAIPPPVTSGISVYAK
jgi:hypothetical protein